MMRGQNPRNYLLVVDRDTQKLQLSITKAADGGFTGPRDGPVVTDGDWHHLAGVLVRMKVSSSIPMGKRSANKPMLNPV